MVEREQNWPLVFFTVLGPASVGCLLATLIVGFIPLPVSMMFVLLTAALVLAGLAFLMSLAHLDKPMRAYRAMKGFPHSNLSREVVSFAGYFVLLGIYWLLTTLSFLGIMSVSVLWLGGLAVLAGLVTVLVTSQVYLIPARPSWHHWSTSVAFFSTALSLGVATALSLSLGWYTVVGASTGLIVAWVLIVIGILGSFLAAWQRVSYLKKASLDTQEAWGIIESQYLGQWKTRLIVGLGASLVLALVSLIFWPAMILAWLCLLYGEILDRKLFFISAIPLTFHGSERPTPRPEYHVYSSATGFAADASRIEV